MTTPLRHPMMTVTARTIVQTGATGAGLNPNTRCISANPTTQHRRPRLRDGYDTGRLSCLQAVEHLKDAGFRHIEVVDCRNGTYVYDAVREREPWRIRVSRASGGHRQRRTAGRLSITGRRVRRNTRRYPPI